MLGKSDLWKLDSLEAENARLTKVPVGQILLNAMLTDVNLENDAINPSPTTPKSPLYQQLITTIQCLALDCACNKVWVDNL